MYDQKYVVLVTELRSLIQTHEMLKETVAAAEADLRWRLAELFKTVKQEDEQKYINLTGMQGFLTTTKEKLELKKSSNIQNSDQECDISGQHSFERKEPSQKWAKSLYRRAVKRCHPDTVKVGDDEYKKELTNIYKSITKAYSDDSLDILMVESYKIFIKPKEILLDQIEILDASSKNYKKDLAALHQTKGYTWSTLSSEQKELFIINFMKQQGVRFTDKDKIKEVINRKKPAARKVGERPKNKLRERVKGRK